MSGEIFEKINQISVLANLVRFKILLALFNSEVEIKGKKLGSHSHTFSEIQQIVDVKGPDLNYHLGIMKNSDLIEKDKKMKGVYHASKKGIKTLELFGVNKELVKTVGSKIK